MQEGYRLNQYVFVEKLGAGGMGEVWLGRHAQLDYPVAIKFLKPEFAHDVELQDRFLNEGKRQAKLDHPHIVKALDFPSEGDRNFLVMQFIEGMALDGRIAEAKGSLEIPEALEISYQMLSALGYAHRQGIVHRDVKPSNILLGPNETSYLTDFGIALAVGQKRVTRFGTAIGTVHYMSPEQIREPLLVDHRTDIYAFGNVLFEMFTGNPPFDDETGNDFVIKEAHVSRQPPKLTALNPAVGRGIEAVVMRALAKKPSDRFQSCDAMIEALRSAAPVPPRRTRPASGKTIPKEFTTRRETRLEQEPGPIYVTDEKRNRLGPIALVSSVLLVASLAGWFYAHKGNVPETSVRPQTSVPNVLVAPEVPKRDFTPAPVHPSDPKSPATEQEKPSVPIPRQKDPQPSSTEAASNYEKPRFTISEVRPTEPEPEAPVLKPSGTGVSIPTTTTSNLEPTPTKPLDVPIDGQSKLPSSTPVKKNPMNPPPGTVDSPGTTIERIPPDNNHPAVPIRPDPQPVLPVIGKQEGTLVWSLKLKKGLTETLNAMQASTGEIEGDPLPGVPVQITISPNVVGLVDSPGPSNAYKTIQIRALTSKSTTILIHWTRLSEYRRNE